MARHLAGIVGLRADQVRFQVSDSPLSPKLSLIAGPWGRTESFFNAGRGMHRHDTRGTPARIDPATADPAGNRIQNGVDKLGSVGPRWCSIP